MNKVNKRKRKESNSMKNRWGRSDSKEIISDVRENNLRKGILRSDN